MDHNPTQILSELSANGILNDIRGHSNFDRVETRNIDMVLCNQSAAQCQRTMTADILCIVGWKNCSYPVFSDDSKSSSLQNL
jgi:hypothetical protein